MSASQGSIDLRNNIFANTATIGNRYAISLPTDEGSANVERSFSNIDYNDYYAQSVGLFNNAGVWTTYTTLAELSGALESADAPRSLMVRAHLGNYALWMSGVFPDYIEMRRWRRGGPDLEYYEEMGRRGFSLAADHRLAAEHGLTTLFAAAAARFPPDHAHLRLARSRARDQLGA